MRLVSALSAAVLTLALLGLGIGPCTDDRLEASEVLDRSADAFDEMPEFLARYELQHTSPLGHGFRTGEIAHASGRVAYSTSSFVVTLSAGEFTSESIFLPPDLYTKDDDEWSVLSPWRPGVRPAENENFDPNFQLVEYSRVLSAMDETDGDGFGTIDRRDYLWYSGSIDWDVFPDSMIVSFVGSGYDGSGPVDVEVWIDDETYLPRRLKMDFQLSLGPFSASARTTFDFLDWMALPAPPPVPTIVGSGICGATFGSSCEVVRPCA